jgi:hypothetical protein
MPEHNEPVYVENPDADFRAMGDDLVVVIEFLNRVVVLNSSARFISEQIRRGLDDQQVAERISRLFASTDDPATLLHEVKRTREELIAAEVLVKRREYEKPRVNVRDLDSALKDMDLSRSTVSQYE